MNKNYLDELNSLKYEYGFDDLISTAQEVLHYHNSFEQAFVDFCTRFLDEQTEQEENATRHETD